MAIALDRDTEAIADRTDPTPPPSRRGGVAAAARLAIASPASSRLPSSWRGRRGRRDLPGRRHRRTGWLLARRSSRCSTTSPTRLDFVFKHHRAGRDLHPRAPPPAAAGVPDGGALVHDARRSDGHRVRGQWSAARPVDARHARLDRRHGDVGAAMDTASQVLVATAMAVVIGIVLGIWAAESRTVSRSCARSTTCCRRCHSSCTSSPSSTCCRSRSFPAMVASVLYAFPVVVRLVEPGVRGVAPNTRRSRGGVRRDPAAGPARRSRFPWRSDAIMLGINQGIIMVLAVVVIGGLVGSGGLGYLVAQGSSAGRLRPWRGRVSRDPRARHRARPCHAGQPASAHGR